MSLLFDENLSPRFAKMFQSLFAESRHVEEVGLRGATDLAIWSYAREHQLTIVSKDNDFRQLAFLHGPPPKVIWLVVGNEGTDVIGRLLTEQASTVSDFLSSPAEGLLILEIFFSEP